eukprot:355407-Chlamydomonas_euryale.AAC.3
MLQAVALPVEPLIGRLDTCMSHDPVAAGVAAAVAATAAAIIVAAVAVAVAAVPVAVVAVTIAAVVPVAVVAVPVAAAVPVAVAAVPVAAAGVLTSTTTIALNLLPQRLEICAFPTPHTSTPPRDRGVSRLWACCRRAWAGVVASRWSGCCRSTRGCHVASCRHQACVTCRQSCWQRRRCVGVG